MKRMVDRGDSLKYKSSTNTFEIGSNLEVKGSTKFNKGITIMNKLEPIITTYDAEGNPVNILLEQPDTITIYSDKGTTYIPIVGTDGIVVKDINLKTIFGNQSIYTEDGTGNIDLYRHQLKVKVGGNAIYFVIISSSNLTIASLQDLTTVTKATNGYFTLAMRPGETDIPLLVTYNNNVWGSSIGAITAITEDKVQPI